VVSRIARADAEPAELHVREAGAGAPLVLLHGLASSSRYWQDLRPLAEKYRVLAPDLLGFGRSPKPRHGRYDSDEHVEALRQALVLRLRSPSHLLGHSLGSVIALHYAATYPDDVGSLTLISLPVLGGRAWGHKTDGRIHHLHRFCVHSRPGNAMFSIGMRAVAPLWNRLGASVRRGVPPEANRDALAATWASYWRSLEEVVYGSDIPALIARVRAPILLIHGSTDMVAPIEPVRALANQSRLTLIEVPSAGHNPYYTQRDPTVRAIQWFLDGISFLHRSIVPAASTAPDTANEASRAGDARAALR
jgi:pimeloyl-ACP methyl ester carboxylesterase